MLENYHRYQRGLTIAVVYPSLYPLCSCGCGAELRGRKKRWSNKACEDAAVIQFLIVKGDVSVIRSILFARDGGVCATCKTVSDGWQADHISPVHKGGGATGIENFQTLCIHCHSKKSVAELNQIVGQSTTISSQTAKT